MGGVNWMAVVLAVGALALSYRVKCDHDGLGHIDGAHPMHDPQDNMVFDTEDGLPPTEDEIHQLTRRMLERRQREARSALPKAWKISPPIEA